VEGEGPGWSASTGPFVHFRWDRRNARIFAVPRFLRGALLRGGGSSAGCGDGGGSRNRRADMIPEEICPRTSRTRVPFIPADMQLANRSPASATCIMYWSHSDRPHVLMSRSRVCRSSLTVALYTSSARTGSANRLTTSRLPMSRPPPVRAVYSFFLPAAATRLFSLSSTQ
jgi:hypothetical protein